MTARNAMIFRCIIQRSSTSLTNTDDYGNDPPDAWVNYLTDVPCYHFYFRLSHTIVAEGRRVESTQTQLLLPRHTDITVLDRILNVVDKKGEVIESEPKRIDHLAHRRDHLLLRLVAIT